MASVSLLREILFVGLFCGNPSAFELWEKSYECGEVGRKPHLEHLDVRE